MNYWIRAYNHKRYRVADFIREHGFIDWEMSNKFEMGDIVFLYLTAPDSRLTFMMEVSSVNMDWNDIAKDEEYYLSQEYFDQWQSRRNEVKYVRYDLLKELFSPSLTLEYLKENGLSAAPRSPRKLQPVTIDFVLSHLE